MEQTIMQCMGIDCSKKDFQVSFSISDTYREIQHLASRKFKNDYPGFKAFNKWISKNFNHSIPMLFVMEATGVYHERLACFLYDEEYKVAVVLPKRAKDFSKTLKVKKVTDKIASQYLATMGLEKKLDLWTKPQKEYRDLRHLTREKNQIQKQITLVKNELEAETSGAWPSQNTLKRLKKTLKFLMKQKAEVLMEIQQVVQSNKDLEEKIRKITTIPGVGLVTAATVLGETNGFAGVKNKRQLVSYAGYDVINQESGTSVNTKARMSKRGNKHIRKSMHMPALSSIRAGGNSKDLFIRLVCRSGVKMKGVVAVQRKLLVLIYTLWKNGTEYDPNYSTIE
jgi:transposase